MRVLTDSAWKRRGLTLLWGATELGATIDPQEAITLRELMRLSSSWPDELPSQNGNAVVAVGLEAALDCLTPEDAERWLEESLRPLVLGFQKSYSGDAALIFWLPSGAERVKGTAEGRYTWECAPPHGGTSLPLGRLLWSGAESDARRLLDPAQKNPDPDGRAWVGLHHPRLS